MVNGVMSEHSQQLRFFVRQYVEVLSHDAIATVIPTPQLNACITFEDQGKSTRALFSYGDGIFAPGIPSHIPSGKRLLSLTTKVGPTE